MEPSLTRKLTGDALELTATGPWTTAHAAALERLVESVAPDAERSQSLTLDVAGLGAMDMLGAVLLDRVVRDHEGRGHAARLAGLSPSYLRLFGEVQQARERVPAAPIEGSHRERGLSAGVVQIGRSVADVGSGLLAIIEMFGAIALATGRTLLRPKTFRLTSTIHHLDRACWQAIPIILLITFLIGGIIAQQGFYQLRLFGAQDLAVDLLAILVLREVGVLIVAIMVAGRSGSSYTAELGTMKMREEIDALKAMSLDPVEVLVLPRVIALIVALPILTLFGSLSALAGGALVSFLYGGMSPAVYLLRLKEAVTVSTFEGGMLKAPFMALVIGVVACSEGLMVKGSAESLGVQTTISVVKSIFLVIVLDGLFAIFLSSIGM